MKASVPRDLISRMPPFRWRITIRWLEPSAVKPEQIDDTGASDLAREIARKIESDMEYPGQIKVTVIREVRASETAK